MMNKNITNNDKINKKQEPEKNILDFGNVLINKKNEDKKSDNDIVDNEEDFKFSTTRSEQFSFDMKIIEVLENYKIN